MPWRTCSFVFGRLINAVAHLLNQKVALYKKRFRKFSGQVDMCQKRPIKEQKRPIKEQNRHTDTVSVQVSQKQCVKIDLLRSKRDLLTKETY
jgi:hypothetical protein